MTVRLCDYYCNAQAAVQRHCNWQCAHQGACLLLEGVGGEEGLGVGQERVEGLRRTRVHTHAQLARSHLVHVTVLADPPLHHR